MAPQPYSRRTHGSHCILGPEAARERPVLASKAAGLFARSVELEIATIQAFATMLGSRAGPASAIFTALRTANVQLTAVEAVAGDVLSERDAELFVAVTDIVQRANVDRNRFAHWCWGYLPRDVDALCVQDPNFRRKYELEMTPLISHAVVSRDGWDRLQAREGKSKTDEVLVYRGKDLDEANERMDRAHLIMRCFGTLIDELLPGYGDPKLYDDLAQLPEVQSALERHRKGRTKRK